MPPPKKRASLPTSNSSTDPSDGRARRSQDALPFPDAVLVGRLGKPHGLNGGVTVELATDNPELRFAPGRVVTLSDGREMELASGRKGDKAWILRFVGHSDRSAAEALRNSRLYVAADDRRPLDTDEYWPDDLVGAVAFQRGERLGVVTAVEIRSGQDRLHIRADGAELMVPFVADLVTKVDTEQGRIDLDLPPGLTEPD